jgi:Arc/MetJ-type ribon-helix-helix transcriptional regulator
LVVSVEISGVLEERLRRLVDLGIYATVAEAVREAVRDFLEKLDLREIALNLYITRGASFQYAVEFAGETYESMIDYFISKGVLPVIGVTSKEEISVLEPGSYVMDGLSLYIAYRTGLVELMVRLKGLGYRFLAPKTLEGLVMVLEARRLYEGLSRAGIVEYVTARPLRSSSDLISEQEAIAVGYARSNGLVLLSDDARTRRYASSKGVRSLSLASLIATLWGLGEEVTDYVNAYRGAPALLPDEALLAVVGRRV